MKVTLDLDTLLEEGRITPDEYRKFSQFSARETGSTAFGILIGFGVIAISLAALFLVPKPQTAIALGLIISAAGFINLHSRQWHMLVSICVLIGALMISGGIVVLGKGSVSALLLVTMILAAGGIVARSWLLIVLAVLALSSCFGARTGYMHAMYFLGIKEPALTVGFFSLFSLCAYILSRSLKAAYEGLAIAAARTGIFLVNLGFWIGSLWGDKIGKPSIVLSRDLFCLFWALALLGAALWAWRNNRRWLLNIAALFGAIHFYTQWFERLGGSPGTVLIAGVLTIGLALGLRSFNLMLIRREDARG